MGLPGLKSSILFVFKILLILQSLIGCKITTVLGCLCFLSSNLSLCVMASLNITSVLSRFRLLCCDLSLGVVASLNDLDVSGVL